MPDLFQLFNRINDPAIQQSLLILKIILGGIGILFVLFIIAMVFRTSWAKFAFVWDWVEFFTFRPFGLSKMTGKWQRIIRRLDTGNEAEFKLTVIEADSIMNDTLKRMGFGGENLGDRLHSITPAIIPNVEDLMVAHQTRNNIVHDPDYRLTLDEARKALAAYEVAFRSLDLI